MVSDSLLFVKGLLLLEDLTTDRVSRTWNLFSLDDRKSNRDVRMCRLFIYKLSTTSTQLKIKLMSLFGLSYA